MNDFGKFCCLSDNEEGFKCGCDDGADTTKMEVKHDGTAYAIMVCTTCEDEATPKNVRLKIQGQIDKYIKLVEDAKELGIELSLEQLMKKKDGVLVVAPDTPPAPAAPALAPQPAPVPEGQTPMTHHPIQQAMPQPIVETAERLLDAEGNRIRQQQIKTKEMQVIQADLHGSGRPIALPKKEIGNTGTTYYTIKRSSDKEMQERFRNQAARSKAPNADAFEPSRYKMCSGCGGEGHTVVVLPNTNGKKNINICEACDGLGMVG